MGGCRCSFKTCHRCSDGTTHFFHFPVKDRVRCLNWIKRSQRLEFGLLKESQLKNKVICQYHFTNDMFVNYKHDRLTFKAVPNVLSNESDTISTGAIMTLLTAKPAIAEQKKIVEDMMKKCHSTPKPEAVTDSTLPSPNESTIVKNNNLSQSSNNDTVVKKLNSKSLLVSSKLASESGEKDVYIVNSAGQVSKIVINVKESDKNKNITPKVNIGSESIISVDKSEGKSSDDSKKMKVHDVTLPPTEKYLINYVKGRTLSKLKPGFSKIVKSKFSNLNVKLDKNIINKHVRSLDLPSNNEPEAVISQTPVMKNVALIEDHLRQFNRNKIMKSQLKKLSLSPTILKKEQQEKEYMKLITQTREEMAEIKKILQKKVPAKEKETAIPSLSKEMLYAAIVPYLSHELVVQVHAEMFPSLAINKT